MKERLRSAFIALFLLSQVLLPLSYYIGDDIFDERFAWRMFSPIRVTGCRVAIFEMQDGVRTPVQPATEVPLAWASLMQRARQPVIVGYARHRCERMRGEVADPDLRASVTCAHPDGSPRQVVTPAVNLCRSLR